MCSIEVEVGVELMTFVWCVLRVMCVCVLQRGCRDAPRVGLGPFAALKHAGMF